MTAQRRPARKREATLVGSVRDAAAAMSWLEATDQATVDLAVTYAERIDAALATGEGQEVTKALYLGPHLLNTLRALGGTPADRKALGVEEATGGKLAQLRSIRGGKSQRGKSA